MFINFPEQACHVQKIPHGEVIGWRCNSINPVFLWRSGTFPEKVRQERHSSIFGCLRHDSMVGVVQALPASGVAQANIHKWTKDQIHLVNSHALSQSSFCTSTWVWHLLHLRCTLWHIRGTKQIRQIHSLPLFLSLSLSLSLFLSL